MLTAMLLPKFPPLKPEVAELLKEHPVALATRLVAGEDPVKVEAKVHAEAEEELLSLLELEFPIQLALLLMSGPFLPLALSEGVGHY